MSILECTHVVVGLPTTNLQEKVFVMMHIAEQSKITSTVLNPSFFIKPQGLKGEGRATFY